MDFHLNRLDAVAQIVNIELDGRAHADSPYLPLHIDRRRLAVRNLQRQSSNRQQQNDRQEHNRLPNARFLIPN
jgi:hypothetical protein